MKWIETLLQLRKDSADSIEKELVQAQAVLNSEQSILWQLKKEFDSIVLPKQSTGMVMQQITLQRNYHAKSLQMQMEKVQRIGKKVKILQESLLEANKEYEQAKYIKADYVKKQMQAQKKQEQKRIDELASQRFYLEHHEGRYNV